MADLNYQPDGDTLLEFLKSNSFARLLRGPVGSGKSAAGCIEVMRRASEQVPSPLTKKRMTRWAVVRNTFPELKTTTMKTWQEWFPEDTWGPILWTAPYTHRIRIGDIDAEVIFLALDKPDDVSKLLSLELTGAFVNEGREVPKAIFDGLSMRVGRYPSKRNGGPTWYGWWADTNPPDDDHWWPIMEGSVPPPDYMTDEEKTSLIQPKNWKFFKQPGAMLEVTDSAGNVVDWKPNPVAENTSNLPPEYYANLITGKTVGWVKVYVGNQIGGIEHDLAVYKSFASDTHVARETMTPNPSLDLEIGWDFGLTPGAVVCQKTPGGRLLVFKEIYRENSGAERFCKTVWEELQKDGRFDRWLADDVNAPWEAAGDEFKGNIVVWGDPAGDERVQTDERTPYTILRNNGFNVRPAPTNDPGLRVDAVDGYLTTMVDGLAGFMIDPSCRMLRRGFEGKYCYEQSRVQAKDGEHRSSPKKNRFSHVHDALQYIALGSGEAARMIANRKRGEQQKVSRKPREPAVSPIDRQRQRNHMRGGSRWTRR